MDGNVWVDSQSNGREDMIGQDENESSPNPARDQEPPVGASYRVPPEHQTATHENVTPEQQEPPSCLGKDPTYSDVLTIMDGNEQADSQSKGREDMIGQDENESSPNPARDQEPPVGASYRVPPEHQTATHDNVTREQQVPQICLDERPTCTDVLSIMDGSVWVDNHSKGRADMNGRAEPSQNPAENGGAFPEYQTASHRNVSQRRCGSVHQPKSKDDPAEHHDDHLRLINDEGVNTDIPLGQSRCYLKQYLATDNAYDFSLTQLRSGSQAFPSNISDASESELISVPVPPQAKNTLYDGENSQLDRDRCRRPVRVSIIKHINNNLIPSA